MSSFVVDGLVLPVGVGRHPALDFCNTRAGWDSPTPKEYLTSYAHLAIWTRECGLLRPASAGELLRSAQTAPAEARSVLDRTLQLRSAAYRIALGAVSTSDFDLVGRAVSSATSAAALRPSTERPGPVAAWVLAEDRLDAPFHALAGQLDDLLCSPLSAAVAACPGAGCGWLFADPRRRRRWCDMAVCGNRAKARRHAQRVAQTRR